MTELSGFERPQWHENVRQCVSINSRSATTRQLVADLLLSIDTDRSDISIPIFVDDVASNEAAILERHPHLYGAALVNAAWSVKSEHTKHPKLTLYNRILSHAFCTGKMNLFELSATLRELFYSGHTIHCQNSHETLMCEMSAIMALLDQDRAGPDRLSLDMRLADIRTMLAQDSITRIEL